jgi:phosphate acetyltransferase
MSQGIYITSAEPGSGKSVIVLGIMEMIAGQHGRLGFFRPVVLDEKKPDNLTSLIIGRYGLKMGYDMMYGCSFERAREMLIKDNDEELLKLILTKYKAMEAECDLVVCVGSDFTDPAGALEFDFNAKVANNLGCAVLPVVKGRDRDMEQVVSADFLSSSKSGNARSSASSPTAFLHSSLMSLSANCNR